MNLHRVWALHGVRHGSLFPSQGLADQFQCWKEHMDIAASAQRFFLNILDHPNLGNLMGLEEVTVTDLFFAENDIKLIKT